MSREREIKTTFAAETYQLLVDRRTQTGVTLAEQVRRLVAAALKNSEFGCQ